MENTMNDNKVRIKKNKDIHIDTLIKSLMDAEINLAFDKDKRGEEEMNHVIRHFSPWKFLLIKVFGMNSSAQILQKTCMYNQTQREFEEVLGDLFWMYEIRNDKSWRSNKIEEAYKGCRKGCDIDNKKHRLERKVA